MKYGFWIGVTSWFILLKLGNIEPISHWGWESAVFLIAIAAYSDFNRWAHQKFGSWLEIKAKLAQHCYTDPAHIGSSKH